MISPDTFCICALVPFISSSCNLNLASRSSNLSTFFAYGILEEDYNINLPNNLSNRYGDDNLKDYKAVKTTIVNKNIFDRRKHLGLPSWFKRSE